MTRIIRLKQKRQLDLVINNYFLFNISKKIKRKKKIKVKSLLFTNVID